MQLKVDTGMSRLGADWSIGAELVERIRALPHLQLVGLYSHLACADEQGDATTPLQQQRLAAVIEALPDRGKGCAAIWRTPPAPCAEASSTSTWCAWAWRSTASARPGISEQHCPCNRPWLSKRG